MFRYENKYSIKFIPKTTQMEEKYTNIKERCLYYAKNQGIGVENFLKSIDMTYGSFKGKAKLGSLNSDALAKIYTKYPNINPEWLLVGKGNMLKTTEEPINQIIESKEGIPMLPFDAFAGMGESGIAGVNFDIIQERYVIPLFEGIEIDFLIPVRGSSMYPKYSSGDVVACRLVKEIVFIQWNKVYVIDTISQGVMMKRLHPSKNNNCITCVSDNEKYPPFDIPKEEIRNIAIVSGCIRLD